MPGKAATRNNKGKNNNGTKKANKPKKPSAKELHAASVAKKAAAAPAPAPSAAPKTAIEEAREKRNAARLEKELKKPTTVTKGSSTAARIKAQFAAASEAAEGHGSLLKPRKR